VRRTAGQGEGLGPFKTLAIRGVMLIDGTGAPPQGPMDIIVSGNRITAVRSAGTPGLPLRQNRQPQADHEIDATGMFLMPGFVDMHVHAGGAPKNQEAEYAYKLWMAHGVTTVRGVGLGPHDFSVREKQRSAQNAIVAPRIYNYQRPGSGWSEGGDRLARQGAAVGPVGRRQHVDGLKLGADGARDHGGAARRGEAARPRQHRAPPADRRRADERDQGGAPRPRHGHALLRALRVAAEGLTSSSPGRWT
jgi:imidazolonepropionase-like amidohydrolase